MKKTLVVVSVVGAAALGTLLGTAPLSAQETSRYPYDPACPWGRLSNGRGMLVRCITRDEATSLPAAGTAKPQKPSASASAAPSAPPSASVAPSAAPSEEPPVDPQKAFALRSIVVTPDEGALPTAEKKLMLGRDKMLECLGKHGGLDKPEAEAQVRFLVSARGRAEGVSVKKYVGMSAAAADCIAHVVDRRLVGTPAAQMMGATAAIRVVKQKK
ncbi:MAG: hypothetical protein IPI67_05850 [Myxococcales bacterium]|nr:hypothetical protein [Myxococcales bacterium]